MEMTWDLEVDSIQCEEVVVLLGRFQGVVVIPAIAHQQTHQETVSKFT